MNKLIRITCLLLFIACRLMAVEVNYTQIAPHPRLLMKAGEEKVVLKSVCRSDDWKFKQQILMEECDKMLTVAPVVYKKEGHRLLAVSREALRRIFFLSYAYRITGEERYAKRALTEMETVCRFDNWNPLHFLDTGEMTMAVAIGYDWLHELINPDQKELFTKGIVNLGLLPSKDERYVGFTRRTNNWNQVCNAGMALGALAVYDEYPALAREIIDRSVSTVVRSMAVYAPDGVYPEGYGYWGYGTDFNVIMIACLESALNTDANLPAMEGFMDSPQFINQMVSPSGRSFNYGDAGEKCTTFSSLYWFADKLNDSGILWNEKVLKENGRAEKVFRKERFLPLSLICTRGLKNASVAHPKEKCWIGRGKTPVMIVRSSWEDKDACYLAMKGSKASMPHGHMDAGSFVFDALGERWASDLGSESYYRVEKAGLSLWDYSQHGDRWKIFRYNNHVHNTLSVKGELFQTDGFVDFEETFTKGHELGAVMNTTPLYDARVKDARRKMVIVDGRELLVDDKVTTADKPVTFEWVLCTWAKAKKVDNSTWQLSQKGKQVKLMVEAPKGFKISLKDNVPPHQYDQSNGNSHRVVVEATIPAGTTEHIIVRLVPQK